MPKYNHFDYFPIWKLIRLQQCLSKPTMYNLGSYLWNSEIHSLASKIEKNLYAAINLKHNFVLLFFGPK